MLICNIIHFWSLFSLLNFLKQFHRVNVEEFWNNLADNMNLYLMINNMTNMHASSPVAFFINT